MSDNSDDEFNGDFVSTAWVPYAERLEWRDVRPIEQDDGPNPIVSIAYSPKCKFIYLFLYQIHLLTIDSFNISF